MSADSPNPERAGSERLQLTCDATSLRRGWPSVVELSLTNAHPHALLLVEARWRAPAEGTHRWERPLLGVVRYDAAEDVYYHQEAVSARSPISLCSALTLPGGRVRSMISLRSLLPGKHSIQLEVDSVELPEAELARRVYCVDPQERHGAQAPYRAWDPERERANDVIARVADLQPVTSILSVEVEVVEDEDFPGEAAASSVEGGTLVGRSRRLAGAWIVRAPDGALHLVGPQQTLRCPPGTLSAEVLDALDQDLPFAPIPVIFRGEAGEALRTFGGLPLNGIEGRVQQELDPSGLWALCAALPRAGVRLTWERHAAIQRGLVVR